MVKKDVLASTIKVERLQTRAATNSDYVDDLAERFAAGDVFPPIVIFTDGKEFWLADGIHRLDAAIQAKKKIGVDERNGNRAEAIAFACGANASHGLRRTNADKRRSVALALSAFPNDSNRKIADMCGVGDTLVHEIRDAQQVPLKGTCHKTTEKTRVGRDGKEYKSSAKKTEKAAEPNGKISSGVTFNPSELESDRDPAPKKDEWDAPIQKHAAKAFETVPRFNEIIKKLREAARLYADLCKLDGGQFLQTCSLDTTGGFKHSGITNAIRDLQASRPAHTLCPYSFNENFTHSKDCLLCHGLNWVPAIKGDRVPERLVKLAKKSACSR